MKRKHGEKCCLSTIPEAEYSNGDGIGDLGIIEKLDYVIRCYDLRPIYQSPNDDNDIHQ